MEIFTADDVGRALPWAGLVAVLDRAFAQDVVVPPRHHHGFGPGTLLVMPAWNDTHLGVKLVTVVPGNNDRGLPAVSSVYQLFSGETGRLLASIDGDELTRRRTAATSAVAAGHLADPRAHRLLIVGSGHVASALFDAFAAVRPIDEVEIWNVRESSARRLAASLGERGVAARAVTDLEAAVRRAQIVSCATLALEVLVQGRWLAPDAHLDLVGSFTPAMRECDVGAITGGRVFVDTPTALTEAGELLDAGLTPDSSCYGGTLRDLSSGRTGRPGTGRTVFKAVGSGLADLAAASAVHEARPSPAG